VALEKQGIHIVRGVFPAILVKDTGLFGKTHGGQTVVLGDDDIAGGKAAEQSVVHAVSALIEDQCLSALQAKFVGGIAQQQTGESITTAQADGFPGNRATVGINQKFHVFTSLPYYIIRLPR